MRRAARDRFLQQIQIADAEVEAKQAELKELLGKEE